MEQGVALVVVMEQGVALVVVMEQGVALSTAIEQGVELEPGGHSGPEEWKWSSTQTAQIPPLLWRILEVYLAQQV